MSLDVYIKNKKKEDREWVANITHNMNKMAQRIFVSENKETLAVRLCLETRRIG